jgi:hypothetical protein
MLIKFRLGREGMGEGVVVKAKAGDSLSSYSYTGHYLSNCSYTGRILLEGLAV